MKLSSLLATWAFAATGAMSQSTLPDAATLNATVSASVQDTMKDMNTRTKEHQSIKVKAFVDQAIQDILGPNARRDGGRVVIDIETNGGKNGWQLYAGKTTTPNIDYARSPKSSAGVRYSLNF